MPAGPDRITGSSRAPPIRLAHPSRQRLHRGRDLPPQRREHTPQQAWPLSDTEYRPKRGVTFERIDAIVITISDNYAARQRNDTTGVYRVSDVTAPMGPMRPQPRWMTSLVYVQSRILTEDLPLIAASFDVYQIGAMKESG